MKAKKGLAAATAALALYWVLTSPHDAAATVTNAAGGLAQAAESLTTFLTALSA